MTARSAISTTRAKPHGRCLGQGGDLADARAEGFVAMASATLELILAGQAPKGDVLATARIAGIMAAKRTDELIPLCHGLPLSEVTVEFEPSRDPAGLRVTATAKVDAKTGVEMEALVAVSAAALTIYDMCKSIVPCRSPVFAWWKRPAAARHVSPLRSYGSAVRCRSP